MASILPKIIRSLPARRSSGMGISWSSLSLDSRIYWMYWQQCARSLTYKEFITCFSRILNSRKLKKIPWNFSFVFWSVLNGFSVNIKKIIRTKIATYHSELDCQYLRGKYSIVQNLPRPAVIEIDDHSYCSVKQFIADFLGKGYLPAL